MPDKQKSLSDQTISGWFWALTEQFGARAVSLIVGVLLARILGPEEFGLIAAVSIFITVSQQIIDGGIAQRVIQKFEIGEEEYHALFFGNLVVSASLSILLVLTSGLIANFMGISELSEIVLFMAIWVFISNAGRVQRTILNRESQYRKLAWINLVAAVAGAGTGLSCALAGFQVWSLIWQMLATASTSFLLLASVVKWRPSRLPRWESLKDLYSFGFPVLACQTLRGASNQLVSVLIAKGYSTTSLGYYERGNLIPRTILTAVGGVLTRVNLNSLSRFQKDEVELERAYLTFLSVASGAMFLGMGSMAIFAEEIVTIVLGEKWLPSILFFQAACLITSLHIAFQLNVDLLKALGKTRVFFNGNMICAIVQVAFILVGSKWGIMGMIYGDIAARVAAVIIMSGVVQSNSKIRKMRQLKEIFSSLIWASGLAAFLWLVKIVLPGTPLQIFVGVTLALGTFYFWWTCQKKRMSEISFGKKVVI